VRDIFRSSLATRLQDVEKLVAISLAVKQRAALVATRGDEVQVPGAVVAMETVGVGDS
jgi:hypothetical protein